MTTFYLKIVLVLTAIFGAGLIIGASVSDGHGGGKGVMTTAYCLKGRMADGTFTRSRSAASNRLPLGTKIRLVGSQTGPNGMRRYVIRDRIGHGTSLDLWVNNCYQAIWFGRRITNYKIGWGR